MKDFTCILTEELTFALGCTEPISIALAASKAREVLGAIPDKVIICCSGNIIKNVKSVTVPNTMGMKGVESAVAIGIFGGDSSLGLEVLSKVAAEDIANAREFLNEDRIEVSLKDTEENLYIDIVAVDAESNRVEIEIKNKHTNIVRVAKNDEIIDMDYCNESDRDLSIYEGLNLKDIFDYANSVDLEKVSNLLETQIHYNTAISHEGLVNNWGSSIGSLLLEEDNGLRTRAKAKAASGSDARMNGCSLPVVINAGSGNQGITCSIPVIEYAQEWRSSKDDLYRALLISNLTALHIKRFIGRLSAFCGVTSEGVAAGAGIAYLDTKDYEIVKHTVGNALMIVSGMLCDGAKASCAAKIAAAVDAGITGYLMAKKGRNFLVGDGLLKEDIEDTIRSIGYIAREGMKETDIMVLNTMIDKK